MKDVVLGLIAAGGRIVQHDPLQKSPALFIKEQNVSGLTLQRAFQALHRLGSVEIKRQFSIRFLARGSRYMTDFERRGSTKTPSQATANLRARLLGIAGLVPQGMRTEIEAIISGLDQDVQLTRWLDH